MYLLTPVASRASFLRVLTTVHLVLAVVIVTGILWVDPSSVSQWFNTFASHGYTLWQHALLFCSLGSGGIHVAVACSAVLVLVALTRGRSPAMRRRLLAIYLVLVAAFLITKAIALVALQMLGEVVGSNATMTLGGWGMVATLFAQATIACIPALAMVLSSVPTSPTTPSPHPNHQ